MIAYGAYCIEKIVIVYYIRNRLRGNFACEARACNTLRLRRRQSTTGVVAHW